MTDRSLPSKSSLGPAGMSGNSKQPGSLFSKVELLETHQSKLWAFPWFLMLSLCLTTAPDAGLRWEYSFLEAGL